MYLSNVNRVLTLIFLSTLLLFTVSCSKSVRFATSQVVPSAEGSVKLTKDPSRLTPPRKVYVVWMQTKNEGNKNLGKLVSSEAYFSTERNAKFSTVTPFTPVKVFITAEDQADVQNPGTTTVLSTDEF
jgi:hypothetical protein